MRRAGFVIFLIPAVYLAPVSIFREELFVETSLNEILMHALLAGFVIILMGVLHVVSFSNSK